MGVAFGLVTVLHDHSHAIHQALETGDYAAARVLIDDIAGFEALRTKYFNDANVIVVK
ncbi:hypothetical protein O8B93_27575 [Agrobacterium rhizogenes]|uniref:hypothetical protein n=1 Tax=Rhizobium rhizogenes TaxID=359 RepID=UPI0022B73C0C|nr:hypothetical protein [Rhizobium rhizogenes]MCZ7451326.1 hypothetical protein [Rhizobium rhizogenes]